MCKWKWHFWSQESITKRKSFYNLRCENQIETVAKFYTKDQNSLQEYKNISLFWRLVGHKMN